MKELDLTYRQTAELIPYARNSRTHTEEQVAEIAASIREFGWTNPVIVDGSATIIAGHARVRAAHMLKLERVPVIERADLTPDQVRAYVIADNRLAERAGWDVQALQVEFAELKRAGFELDLTGFDEKDRKRIDREAARARAAAENGEPGEDELPEYTPKRTVSRTGDVWHCGPHRVGCGDSLKQREGGGSDLSALIGQDQVHLIVTDPPYAIYGSSTGIASNIADDKMVRPFFEQCMAIASKFLPWFGHAYYFTDWRSWASLWEAAKGAEYVEPKNALVWDKGGSGLGSSYAMTYEMIGFFAKLPPQTAMKGRQAGQRTILKPNVIRANRPTGQEREHNAAKPVGLLRELIEVSSGPGDCVLDPFCGSGSTMIAADQLGRVCVTMDAEPGWVDVAVRRFMRLRSEAATLGEDGPSFDEVAKQRLGTR